MLAAYIDTACTAQMATIIFRRLLQEAEYNPQSFMGLFSMHNHQLSEESVEFYCISIDESPYRVGGRRFPAHTPCIKIVPAVLTSLVAILFLVSKCSFAQMRKEYSFIAHRGLSDDETLAERSLLACGGTQEETGFDSSDEPGAPTSSSSKKELGSSDSSQSSEPRAKKAKTDDEGTAQAPQTLPSSPPVPSTSGPALAGWSLSELTAADALLLLQQRPFSDEMSYDLGKEEVQTTTFFAAKLPTEKVPLRETLPAHSPKKDQPSLLEANAAPSTLKATPVPDTPARHPFFSLPTLQAGVIPKLFDAQRTLISGISRRHAMEILCKMHRLLSKEFLNQEQTVLLMAHAELIAAFLYHQQRKELHVTETRRALEDVATRFMAFDAIIAAFQVTGQPVPEDWWCDFAAQIPHTFPELPSGRRRTLRLHRDLKESLMKGMVLLKSGVRPSNNVLFKAKYLLFCSKHTIRRFKTPLHDLWRKDCPETSR